MTPYRGLVGVRFVLSPPNRDGNAEVNVPFIGAARKQPYDCVAEPDSLAALETRGEEYPSFLFKKIPNFIIWMRVRTPLGSDHNNGNKRRFESYCIHSMVSYLMIVIAQVYADRGLLSVTLGQNNKIPNFII